MWTVFEHSLLESYKFVYIILILILIHSSGVNTSNYQIICSYKFDTLTRLNTISHQYQVYIYIHIYIYRSTIYLSIYLSI